MKAILIILCVLLLLSGMTTLAVAATGYNLSWWTVDGGGGALSGSGYHLSGTIGQPEAAPVMSATGYRLAGGFWGGALTGALQREMYLPLLMH